MDDHDGGSSPDQQVRVIQIVNLALLAGAVLFIVMCVSIGPIGNAAVRAERNPEAALPLPIFSILLSAFVAIDLTLAVFVPPMITAALTKPTVTVPGLSRAEVLSRGWQSGRVVRLA
ncbi:MAG: hypothetical protein ACRC1K_19610, partial [Planctomycetia bacterium]